MSANDGSGHAASASSSESSWHKKRKTMSTMDSGVLQRTDPSGSSYRLIFADAGCLPSWLHNSLIKDDRKRLGVRDLLQTAQLYEASIIIGSDFPANTPPNNSNMSSRVCKTEGMHATSWHVWYDLETWSVAEFRTVPMCTQHPRLRFRSCAIMHLCH